MLKINTKKKCFIFDADGIMWKNNSIQILGEKIGVKNEYKDLERQIKKNPKNVEMIFKQGMKYLVGMDINELNNKVFEYI